MSEYIIEYIDVSKSYKKKFLNKNKKIVLNNVSFKVRKGHITGLFAPSGCGKSTLLKLFFEINPIDSGKILYNGVDIKKMNKKQKKELRKNVQIVFQDPINAFHPTKMLNVSLLEPLKIFKIYEKEKIDKKIKFYMELLGLEEILLFRYPYQLSGGQLQRFAFLRTLLLEPECIFLDEATSMLDVSVQAELMQMVKQINKIYNTTFVIISHDKYLIENMCSTIFEFKNEKLIKYSV